MVVGAVLAPIIEESRGKPDFEKMRTYRVSLLTNAQMAQFRARAAATRRQQESDEQRKAGKMFLFVTSPGDLFEQYLMGSCLTVRSVHEARQDPCLP
jgi:hypothetical protein